jgi:hypothetical protein
MFQDDANSVYKLSTSDASRTLNSSEMSKCVQRPATDIAEDMRNLILRLYGQFISDDGMSVDYKGIGASAPYKVTKSILCFWRGCAILLRKKLSIIFSDILSWTDYRYRLSTFW